MIPKWTFVASLLAALFPGGHHPRRRGGGLVQAFPEGAPVCTADQAAPGGSHTAGAFTESSIADGGIRVSIEGIGRVESGTPTELAVGTEYTVTVAVGGGDFFRGIMTRLDGGDNNVDTTSALSLVDDEVDLQISGPCTSAGVSVHRDSVRDG